MKMKKKMIIISKLSLCQGVLISLVEGKAPESTPGQLVYSRNTLIQGKI